MKRVAAALALTLTGVACSLIVVPREPTGDPVAGLESFDRLMEARLAAHNIPGGALAVGRNGRLVFNRGHGLADVQARQEVRPDSLFRIGSVSKVFTAVAVLKLVEEGRLSLDDKAFRILSHLEPPPGTVMEARFSSITVAHLLTHTAGWDEPARGQDAAMEPRTSLAAKAFGVPAPPSSQVMIRYALGQPLDFTPGERAVYSNLGYVVLGRVIETVSGQTYEQFVRRKLLEPLGLGRMRLARSLLSGRAPGEVRYYSTMDPIRSVFPNSKELVPVPYGGLHMEAIDSSGGWVASPADLVRFVAALDGSRAPALLKPETVENMIGYTAAGPRWSYALGWGVAKEAGGIGWLKMGSTGGDCTYLRRRPDGVIIAASFNQSCDPGLDQAVVEAVRAVRTWPAHDLFASR